MNFKIIEDLGMIRDIGGTTRRWCIAECVHCGEKAKHRTQSLRMKRSCGCISSHLKKEASTKHGCHRDRLYQTWADMKTRCTQQNNKRYHKYGGRGISVCDEWKDFVIFKRWAIANGYNDTLTIDRINNDGNYEPSNCEWVTIQENLRRRNKYQGWKNDGTNN